PEGEVGVGHSAYARRVARVADVEQKAVAAARATRETDRRVDGDVVALRGCTAVAGGSRDVRLASRAAGLRDAVSTRSLRAGEWLRRARPRPEHPDEPGTAP